MSIYICIYIYVCMYIYIYSICIYIYIQYVYMHESIAFCIHRFEGTPCSITSDGSSGGLDGSSGANRLVTTGWVYSARCEKPMVNGMIQNTFKDWLKYIEKNDKNWLHSITCIPDKENTHMRPAGPENDQIP